MKIAILLPGHLRTWDYCRANFLENLYDRDHEIDVFVDTYYNNFRLDIYANHERNFSKELPNQEIQNLFNDINVVNLSIETESNNPAIDEQKRKILKIVKTLEEFPKEYDLIVRSRFDILVQEKVDYNSIWKETEDRPNLIYLGRGSVNGINDMFAVCRREVFGIYGNRFTLTKNNDPHNSLYAIENRFGVKYSHSIPTATVRIGVDGRYRVEKSGMPPVVLEKF